MRIGCVHRGRQANTFAPKETIEFRAERLRDEFRRPTVYLFVELVLLRLRIEGLHRIFHAFPKPDDLPVENQIDVLREAFNQPVRL